MVSLAQLGEARFLLGVWTEARVLYERAVRMSHVYPAPHYAAFALLGLGALNLAEGRWEEATDLIEMCIADAERTNDVHWVRNAERLLAHRDLLLGRPEGALARLKDEGDDHTGTLYLRAWAHLDAGDVQRAVTTVDRAIALATARSSGLDLCEALIVRGRIDARQGRLEDAEGSFGEALSLALSLPYPYGEARARYEWGKAQSVLGQDTLAQHHIAEAHEILQRLGAKFMLNRAREALAALPRSGRRG
jgi:tetratricopeptide (TPR) repeat protein